MPLDYSTTQRKSPFRVPIPAMPTGCSRGFLVVAATLLLVSREGYSGDLALAKSPDVSNAKTWLDTAVLDKQCPWSPVNVPATLPQTRNDALRQRISVVGDTLIIEGTPTSDRVSIKAGRRAGVVRVVFGGRKSRKFGPIGQILVLAGASGDRVVVDRRVKLPARLEGGAGDDCLQGGSGPDLLFGEDGNDVLIAGTGRPALDAGPGRNRIIVPHSMGEIRVAPSADGEVLRQLTNAYKLRALLSGARKSPGQHSAHDDPPSPIILGAADLRDARIGPLLQETYAASQAVALTNATAADAARLRLLLEHPNAAEGLKGDETAALIFVRKAPRPGIEADDFNTGIFGHPPIPAISTGGQSGKRDLDERTIELLSRVFSATAIVPEGPSDSPSNDLQKIADSYTSSSVDQNPNGSQVQVVNMVWNVRSFDPNKADFYYVLQNVEYLWAAGESGIVWANSAESALAPFATSPTFVTPPSPASTQCSVSTTSGTSWNIGGSTGWNEMQGLNAAITGGVSVSNSETITCPQTTINNESDPASGITSWIYALPGPNTPPQLISFTNQWIWEVPFSNYMATQEHVKIESEAELSFVTPFGCTPFESCPTIGAGLNSVVPLPFGQTFELQDPVVLSVSPTCVNAGNTFVISGTGMYPSLVTSVLIDGSPLDSSQYTTTSDTSITVIAPEQSGEALPVVVQTTQGVSNASVTIEISVIDLCNL